jgi:hypothetical protein
MNTYETTAIVEERGQVRVAGVPFELGTEVEVTIRAKAAADASHPSGDTEDAPVRMKDLFARVRARNTEPVGPLRSSTPLPP